MKITFIYPIALRLSLLVACEVAATDERRLKSFPKATKAPAKAKAGKQGKGVTSSVPDDNSTGDSNGEIEIPLDSSMPTSLSVPAGEDLSGEIDTSIEIPLDASMPTSLSVPAGDIPGDSFGKIDEIPFDASLSMSF